MPCASPPRGRSPLRGLRTALPFDRVIEAEWQGRSDLTKTVLLVGLAANALLSAHALLVADAKFQSFAEVIFAGVDLNSVDCPWGDGEAGNVPGG